MPGRSSLRDISACGNLLNSMNTWRLATSVAIHVMSGDYQEATFTYIINTIEEQYSMYPSSDDESIKQQLRGFLMRCAELKVTLIRQKQLFSFHYSPPGTESMSQSMNFGGADGDPA
ncbi:hypothetical protein BDV25DRAFT_138607 [Aspergillus avenaceus]|uniref:Uncharacterized protein n=1 Tax=Aspergillus avenaceus TaxID=36643 RepID=A0A5N6TZI2_ASPAV|nr:hypothetical protein BDV25DRAFT_138607 [Aspergillus avenaceus]